MRSGADEPVTFTFTLLGEGRNRRVYLSPSGRTALKVLMSEAGVSDNLIERIRYRKWRGQGRYAPCRFLGSSILVMEYVEPIGWGAPNAPEWAKYIDCGQVGTNRHGKVLAYDYGD